MPPIPKFIEDKLENDKNETEKGHFPYVITKVDEDVNNELLRYFTGEKTGFVQVGPKKWFFPSGYEQEAANYYNFMFRPSDVIVATFPRSGTTWVQEMVWLLVNNLDYQKAAEIPLDDRFPFLEYSCFVHKATKAEFMAENASDNEKLAILQDWDVPAWKILGKSTGPRFIKTHLPFTLLPPDLLNVGCKVIYVARNPKDVAVSFYHLNRLARTQGYIGDFSRYWGCFERNLQPWTPYWEHIKEGWERRKEENMQFYFYEDINKDLREQYDVLENHLKIENFKNNKSVNSDLCKRLGIFAKEEQGFVRKGEIGGWKDYFDEKLNGKADQWIQENLKDTDIVFPIVNK
ncbi:hypothetical protein NQ317_007290 [Molorchus minor]|uniref:Sulfotransferase domain-containing protein n=1 Tax=Molorchus minor TaxID=1323400 RepID=A0ABQ9JV26_9CUCU|nr:hypothetical protein NQ317_007290 [Molorchus minor]